ncbi:hypothetical protein MKW98_001535 [Papaver atlanticum]|uniref:Diacylglycerol O-acyltransferase n=1 Tax=Papaver atlanticum TaxID=357466 RepID=A0AAD4X9U7_9MAGN|nr:hypothetical protein MKW98_001535 [Papaver atlanticum]
MNKEEPLTPFGRKFLQEEGNKVINFALNLKNSISLESVKAEFKNSILIQHPSFQSVLVRNTNTGEEYWKRGDVNLDKHIFLIQDIGHGDGSTTSILSNDEIVNGYLADLSVSSPLSIDKPLWELHVLKDQNCLVLRVNHAIGDGVSVMSLFLTMFRKFDQPDQLPSIPKHNNRSSGQDMVTIVYVMGFLLRCLYLKDAKSTISGGHGVELWSRKLATARFKLDDMKSVKNAVRNATINDVLFGVVTSGLSRYLDYHRASNSEGLQISGMAMVNLREQRGLQDMANLVKSSPVTASWWGNKFGYILLPIYPHKNVGNNPLRYVVNAKEMLDKKKLSLEAHIVYAITKSAMSLLGPKVTYLVTNRVMCHTSFTITNVVGPQEEVTFGGNPVTSLRATSSSSPHALTMHMISYAGKAEMNILVAKDTIPDPQFLAKCFEDSLLELKEASTATSVKTWSEILFKYWWSSR